MQKTLVHRTRFYFFLAVFVIAANISHAQSWLWAQSAVSHNNLLTAGSFAADAKGNTYITGSFFDTVTIGNTTLTSKTYVSFLAALDKDGNTLWAEIISGDVAVRGMCLDAAGNIIIAGTIPGNTRFTDMAGSTQTVVAIGGDDIFVAKYDNQGSFKWVKTQGSMLNDVSGGVAADNAGNIYTTGHLGIFGGGDTAFISKYNAVGSLQWTNRAVVGSCHSNDIITDANGNSIITGRFISNISFGNPSAAIAINKNIQQCFVARFDANGNNLWIRNAGGDTTTYTEGGRLAKDDAGNIYITGIYEGNIKFSSLQLSATDSFGPGVYASDMFVAKGDTTGNFQWLKGLHGAGSSDITLGIAADAAGGCYVAGVFYDSIVLGNAVFHCAKLRSDIFWTQLDANGNITLATQHGGSGFEYVNGLSAIGANAWLMGTFEDHIDFSSGVSLKGNQNSSIFLAKFGGKGTGINMLADNVNSFTLFPNPASDKLYIRFADRHTELSYISITTIDGKQIDHLQNPDWQKGIDISHLSPGQYWLRIIDKHTLKLSTKSFIKL